MGTANANSSLSAGEKYIKAIALIELGLSVTRACEKVGLHPQTYYYHQRKKGAAPDSATPQLDTAPETNRMSSPTDSHDTTVSARRRERSA
jgi:hypothetical protein